MKSFGKYISKYLISFLSLIVLLALVNVLCFGWMFYATVMRDYGTDAPRQMLNRIETAVSPEGMDQSFAEKLCDSHIWAMYMRPDGTLFWSVDRPRDVPARYTMSDVAVFAKGYISDYPVFTRNTDDGILVLGYPKDSYMKLTENYYSIATVRKLPAAALMILAVDVILLFGFYSLSKRRIISKTGPIIASIQALSDGKVLLLSERGELSEIAGSINKASRILSRQNEARANWIAFGPSE